MSKTYTSAELSRRISALLSGLKRTVLPRDCSHYADLLHHLRSSEPGRLVVQRLARHPRPAEADLLFLLALQTEMLQREVRSLSQRFLAAPSPKIKEALHAADPRRKERLLAEARAEEAAANPVAHAARKVEGQQELARLMASGRQDASAVRKRGGQDSKPPVPLASEWMRDSLEMDIYELADALSVRRSTLIKFFKARRIKGHPSGRRLLYAPPAVRRAVKEWLTNPYWHGRDPIRQWTGLMQFLHSTARHRPAAFAEDVRLVAKAIAAVSRVRPDFRPWLAELTREVAAKAAGKVRSTVDPFKKIFGS